MPVAAQPATQPDENVPFKVEQRGIELIPDAARTMRPAGLFWLWAGAVWNVEFLVYGALIMSFGLSFGQAVLAIVVGNLFYVLLGIASLQGPTTGTTAFMVSRAPFGQNANRVVAFFNWITQVGLRDRGHRHHRAGVRGDVPARRPDLPATGSRSSSSWSPWACSS